MQGGDVIRGRVFNSVWAKVVIKRESGAETEGMDLEKAGFMMAVCIKSRDGGRGGERFCLGRGSVSREMSVGVGMGG